MNNTNQVNNQLEKDLATAFQFLGEQELRNRFKALDVELDAELDAELANKQAVKKPKKSSLVRRMKTILKIAASFVLIISVPVIHSLIPNSYEKVAAQYQSPYQEGFNETTEVKLENSKSTPHHAKEGNFDPDKASKKVTNDIPILSPKPLNTQITPQKGPSYKVVSSEVSQAIKHYQAENYESAINLLYALKSEANTHHIDFYLGLSHLEQNDVKKAIIHLEKTISTTSKHYNLPAQWYLGIAYLKSGDTQKALGLFKKLAQEQQQTKYSIKANQILQDLDL